MERICPKCYILGDEYHFLFYCSEDPSYTFTGTLHKVWRNENVFRLPYLKFCVPLIFVQGCAKINGSEKQVILGEAKINGCERKLMGAGKLILGAKINGCEN